MRKNRSKRALETQTRKLERLEADFAQAKVESLGLKEQTQSLEAALIALRNKQEEKKANDENIASKRATAMTAISSRR